MLHEQLAAFHQALRLGPGHCPPDLFIGTVPSIVRGLKVHANNIAHARHLALEESYPRLVSAMGLGAFHSAAELFLNRGYVSDRSLDWIGKGFESYVAPEHRDLAVAEWTWLETFHAAEADALTLQKLASLTPETLLCSRFGLHSAARWFVLDEPDRFAWDHEIDGDGPALLLTRPGAEVLLRRIDAIAVHLLGQLSEPRASAELLGMNPSALITIIDSGAVVLETCNEA